MTERSLTPSPHRSQNLERGVFSSLSALSLYKQSVEERKQIQSSSTIISKKSPLPKPRSPNRVRQITKRVEKSPESQPRSPLKVTNRGREDPEPRSEQEFTKLQESIRTLKLLLEKEKRLNAKLEIENKEIKNSLKQEAEKSEKIHRNLRELMSTNTGITQENVKLTEEIKVLKENQDLIKEHVKSLATILVSVLTSFFSSLQENESLVSTEKTRVVSKIKEIVAQKLEDIQLNTSLDLTRQTSEVRSWLLARNFPRAVSIKQEEPEISYTVEYFNEPLSVAKPEPLARSYFHKSEDEEISFHECKMAIALYDFEGEREDDLEFYCGDTIEIVEQCESGWWIGKLNGKTGSFPYNFVQVL